MAQRVDPLRAAADAASAEAESLSAALVSVGAASASPPAAVEWMFAYAGARPLLRLLTTSLVAECQLTADESERAADLPAPDQHVLARALPAVRGARRTLAAPAQRARLKLLEGQRDALAPLVASMEKGADAKFERERKNPPEEGVNVKPATLRARTARARLAALLPLVPTGSAAEAAGPLLAAERALLAGKLRGARDARARMVNGGRGDAAVAHGLISKYAPLCAAAAARGARAGGQTPDEEAVAAEAAHNAAIAFVAGEIAARGRRRARAAIDATMSAVTAAAAQRVRLELLRNALASKREVHAMLHEYLTAAASASGPQPKERDTSDNDALLEQQLEGICAEADAAFAELWGDAANVPDVSMAELRGKIEGAEGPASELLVQTAAHAHLASTESAVRPLEALERAVANNGAALETLLRERRNATAEASVSASESSGSTFTVLAAGAEAESEALVEFHVGRLARSGVSPSAMGSAQSSRSGRSVLQT